MTLPTRNLSSTAQDHLNDHNVINPGYQYTIRQTSLGGSIASRPNTAVVPNGAVTWLLFNEPGQSGGPTDVQALDLVINISGTPW